MRRDGATIHDITVADGPAYLVEPDGGGRGTGLLFLHWFDTAAPDGNRDQFVEEAIELARELGAVAMLPQGRFPWASDPAGAEADVARIRSELDKLKAAVDILAARPDVAAGRMGLVGHDFGGMYGTLLTADDPRLHACVLIASTPRWGDWFLPFWEIAGDRHEYLRALAPLDPISRVGDIAPRRVLFQFARNDFFIAGMTGLEFQRAGGPSSELKAYDADHSLRDPAARADRLQFLRMELAA